MSREIFLVSRKLFILRYIQKASQVRYNPTRFADSMLRGIQSSDSVHKQKPCINHIRDSKSAELCVNIYL